MSATIDRAKTTMNTAAVQQARVNALQVGTIVHYMSGFVHCAAIVTALSEDRELGQVELSVFLPGFGLQVHPRVYYNPHQRLDNTWHFLDDDAPEVMR